jgi:hypothetical protein
VTFGLAVWWMTMWSGLPITWVADRGGRADHSARV